MPRDDIDSQSRREHSGSEPVPSRQSPVASPQSPTPGPKSPVAARQSRVASRFASLHLALVLLLSPLLLFPRIEWMPVAWTVPVLWIAGYRARRHFIEPNLLNPLLLPLLLMVLVSTWATFDIEFSLGKIAGTLLGVFLLLAAIEWISTPFRFAIGVFAFAAGGAGLALVCLTVTSWPNKFPLVGQLRTFFPPRFDLPRLEGAFNANPAGGTMLLFIPLAAVLLYGLWRQEPAGLRRRLLSVALAAALGLPLLVLVLSQSRGAWAGFVASSAFLLAVRFRWVRWALLGGLVVAAGTLAVWAPWSGWEAEEMIDSASGEIGLEARLEIWNRAIYGIQDFPFTGMGMNAFRRVVHILYPLFLVPPDTDIASAHDQWLQTALDLGIPGLVAYVAIWTALGRMLWLVSRRSQRPWFRLLAVGLAGGLVAQFVYLIADAIPLGAKIGIFWWALAALVVALFKLEFGHPDLGRWRIFEIFVTWVLLSLVSISFVGEHPYVSLAIAGAGGVYLGMLATGGLGAE